MTGPRAVFVALLTIAYTVSLVSAEKVCQKVKGLTVEDLGDSKLVSSQYDCRLYCLSKPDECTFIQTAPEGSRFRCRLFKVLSAATEKDPSHYKHFPKDFPKGAAFSICDIKWKKEIALKQVKASSLSWMSQYLGKQHWPYLCQTGFEGCYDNSCLASSLDDKGKCIHYNSEKPDEESCVCWYRF